MKYRVVLVGRTHERKFNILLSFVSYCERKIANGGPYQVICGGNHPTSCCTIYRHEKLELMVHDRPSTGVKVQWSLLNLKRRLER